MLHLVDRFSFIYLYHLKKFFTAELKIVCVRMLCVWFPDCHHAVETWDQDQHRKALITGHTSLHHLEIIFIRATDVVMTPFILYNWTCVWIKIFQSSFKKKLMGMSSMWSCLNKSWWCCIRWYQDDTCYSAFSPQIRGQGSQCWSVTMLHHTDHCSSLTQLIVYNDSDNSDNAVNIVITMWDHVPEWQEPVWLPSHLGHLHLCHQCLLLPPPHRGLRVSQEPGQFSKKVVHLSWLHVKPG